MVFQDYELIQTKRVAANRQRTNPMSTRVWNAMGGWNTLYVTLLFGYGGYSFRQVCCKYLIANPSLASSRGALFWTVVPAIVALGVGGNIFGDVQEYRRLTQNRAQYEAEFQNYKQELFYS